MPALTISNSSPRAGWQLRAAVFSSSTDQGKMWKGGEVLGQKDFVSVRAQGSTVLAATRSGVFVSDDAGKEWEKVDCQPTWLASAAPPIASDSQFMVASREGAFRSDDGGLYLAASEQRATFQGHLLCQLRCRA